MSLILTKEEWERLLGGLNTFEPEAEEPPPNLPPLHQRRRLPARQLKLLPGAVKPTQPSPLPQSLPALINLYETGYRPALEELLNSMNFEELWQFCAQNAIVVEGEKTLEILKSNIRARIFLLANPPKKRQALHGLATAQPGSSRSSTG
jgi:hypothetical protein